MNSVQTANASASDRSRRNVLPDAMTLMISRVLGLFGPAKSLFENAQARSRRREEADRFLESSRANPPPHVGGYTFQTSSKIFNAVRRRK